MHLNFLYEFISLLAKREGLKGKIVVKPIVCTEFTSKSHRDLIDLDISTNLHQHSEILEMWLL